MKRWNRESRLVLLCEVGIIELETGERERDDEAGTALSIKEDYCDRRGGGLTNCCPMSCCRALRRGDSTVRLCTKAMVGVSGMHSCLM